MFQAVLDNKTRQDDATAIVYLFGSILNRTEGGLIHLPLKVNKQFPYSIALPGRTQLGEEYTKCASFFLLKTLCLLQSVPLNVNS